MHTAQQPNLFELLQPTLLAASSFQWILLIGCGLLAVALLFLTLTRWGHVRPIWKCVVLSVVAHLILIGYMYGTHLISRAPVIPRTETIKMNVVDSIPEPEVEAPKIEETEPEEHFADTDFMPELEPLGRPELDSEIEISDSIAKELGKAFENVGLKADQSPFLAEPATIKPSGIPAQSVSNESASPEEIEFQRRDPTDDELEEIPMLDEGGDFEVPRIEPEIDDLEITPPEIEAPPAEIDIDQNQFQPIQPESYVPEATRHQPETADTPVIENSPETEMVPVSRLRRASDNAPMPKLYSLRSENRQVIAKHRGGTEASEQAVAQALKWLANHQSADGRWDSDLHGGGVETRALGHNRNHAGVNADTGMTALALLAFMASGNSHFDGQYRENVQHGLEYLISQQKPNGQLAGDAKLFARMYCHSMALLALSEALAVTGDERIKGAVERGVQYTVRAQNRTDGGWRYQPGDAGDMSQFGWKVLALHSASLGGVQTPTQTLEGMQVFLDQCTSGRSRGLGSYRPNEKVSSTMTAESLVCRYFLQGDVSHDTIDEAVQQIQLELPNEREINLYYWYYGTMAMYHSGGEPWRQWNEALQTVLVSRQVKSGTEQGSWDPDGVWGGYGGRVYSTAMAALCLEVYYRHLPIYEARVR